jgi:hypothetical protein
MHDVPSVVREQHQHEQQAYVAVGTKKSAATISPTWCFRNVCHVCDGGRRRRGTYLATVPWLIEIPSLSSSPWSREAPQLVGVCHGANQGVDVGRGW